MTPPTQHISHTMPYDENPDMRWTWMAATVGAVAGACLGAKILKTVRA